MGFYWSYILLLEPLVLMCCWYILYVGHKSTHSIYSEVPLSGHPSITYIYITDTSDISNCTSILKQSLNSRPPTKSIHKSICSMYSGVPLSGHPSIADIYITDTYEYNIPFDCVQ